MTVKNMKKSPLVWLYAGGAILLLVAVWLWCFKVTMDPERVFWGTIERSLATHGVTIQAEQNSQGTKAKQTIRYSLGADNLSHTVTRLTQGNTTVVNEVMGTPTADYTRYVDIKTDQKRASGGKMNFSKLLGVWASGQDTSGQFFTQAVFGASLPIGGMGVPIGNLAPKQRAELVKQIRDDVVYQINFSKVKKASVNGRTQYTYDATLRPVSYVSLMKRYSQNIGLHGLDQLNPESYKGQKPFTLRITVDARARQVVSIMAPDTNNKQTYSSYDVPVQIRPPVKPISATELQKRLSEIQQ